VRSIVADTSSVVYTHVTGGSRVTFATGMAIVEASKKVVKSSALTLSRVRPSSVE
jgi:hypothetical protein